MIPMGTSKTTVQNLLFFNYSIKSKTNLAAWCRLTEKYAEKVFSGEISQGEPQEAVLGGEHDRVYPKERLIPEQHQEEPRVPSAKAASRLQDLLPTNYNHTHYMASNGG